MNTKGQHLIIDAFECNPYILNDADSLKKFLTNAINDLGMEIISVHFHSFSPQGVTGVIGISTSHFSIHTWPEKRYAALDLYTCGDFDIWPTFNKILNKLEAKRVEVNELVRGEKLNGPSRMGSLTPIRSKVNNLSRMSSLTPITRRVNNLSRMDSLTPIKKNVISGKIEELIHVQADKGNPWDNIQLAELSNGKHDVLFRESSEFQDIFIVKANDIRLYLDQELQFSSLDEKYYHEALVFPVMELAANHNRVLILGGGDGLALREVLKYADVNHVDLVDIDPMMVQVAKTHPTLLELNNRSFHDKRVNVHNMDAKIFIEDSLEPYDVIIIDFPDPAVSILSSLYTKELFSKVSNILSENGALVCQSTSPEDTPKAFWSIAKTMKTAGLNTLPYNIVVPSFGLWGFHLAAHRKITNFPSKISVPHKALSTNLEFMLNIPSDILSFEKKAIVNSIDNSILHDVYQKEINNWYQ